jgi:cytochrome c biogenesis protein CcmG/thiol:disulfide interchange protein DsbE
VSRRRIAAVVVAVVAAVVVVGLLLRPSGSGSGPAGNGQAAPLFQTFDLQGAPVALKDFRGHRVVLNFWASWCEPCRAEFSVLRQLRSAHPDVTVLGVVFEDTDGPARAFLKSQGATWPGLVDTNGQIALAYNVQRKPGIPVSVLVGPDGIIRNRRLGPLQNSTDAQAFLAFAPAS